MATKAILIFGPEDHGRPVTREEVDAAQWEPGYHYEIIRGEIYVSPVPNIPHDCIVKWLDKKLEKYAEKSSTVINYISTHPRVFVPEQDEMTVPEPDLAAYHDFPYHVPIEQRDWRAVSPILVIEVVSEDDPDKDLIRNVDLYQQVPSIREYWIIDPRGDSSQTSMFVHRRRGQRWLKPIEISFNATYTTNLLPGFRFKLDLKGA